MLTAAAARTQKAVGAFIAEAAIAAAREDATPGRSPSTDALIEFMQARLQVRKIAESLQQAVAMLNASGEEPKELRQAAEAAKHAVPTSDGSRKLSGEALRDRCGPTPVTGEEDQG